MVVCNSDLRLGQVTLISAAIILSFTMMEFFDYRRVTIDTSIMVDKSRGEKLTAKMNVTFPRVPCYRECYFHLPGTAKESGDPCFRIFTGK